MSPVPVILEVSNCYKGSRTQVGRAVGICGSQCQRDFWILDRKLKVLRHHQIGGRGLCFKGGKSVTILYRVPLPRLLFRTRLASRSASSCLHSESTLGPVNPSGSVPPVR